jgi:hypothetical protein
MIWFMVAASVTCLMALLTAIQGRIALIRKAKTLDLMMNKLPGEFIRFGVEFEQNRITKVLETEIELHKAQGYESSPDYLAHLITLIKGEQ